MLGVEVVEAMRPDWEVLEADLEQFDVSNERETLSAVREASPDVVVNCAAYTDVDGAETHRDAAFATNAAGAGSVAKAAAAAGARIIHLSTDYVFDGAKAGPYTEDDPPNPVSVYGESKLAGEVEVRASGAEYLILRTAWLYGHGGGNFVETVLRLAGEGGPLRIVDDQRGSPTYARDLASVIRQLATGPGTGILNATNSGDTTWYGFAVKIVETAGLGDVRVEPVATSEFPRPAPRPRSSVLSLDRLSGALGWTPRSWDEALTEYLSER
ncbi:MAG: dTDP-4-dehydrorhamnose reductase [Candidatus Eisenbacteria bacterium]|nr:dTDP-4-dehydrorhamnose reductase [Candidatus Eisenbacteria bacterium]